MIGATEKTQVSQEYNLLETGTTLSAPPEFQGINEYGGIPCKYFKRTEVCVSFSYFSQQYGSH